MGIEECSAAVIKCIIIQCSILAVSIIVCLTLVFWHKHYREKYAQYRHKKDREKVKTIEPARDWSILIVVGVLAVCALKTVPAIIDLRNESYICVYGEYSREREELGVSVKVTTDDGTNLVLRIPSNCGLKKPPLGKHTATIWYGETSGYLLYFVMDD